MKCPDLHIKVCFQLPNHAGNVGGSGVKVFFLLLGIA